MDWASVVDTAVKIGLGGIIASAGTYLAQRSRERHEILVEHTKRRFDLIERVAADFDQFVTKIEEFLINCPLRGELDPKYRDEYHYRTTRQLSLGMHDAAKCHEYCERAHSAANSLSHAITLLRLLGRTKCADAMKNYRLVAEQIWLYGAANMHGHLEVNQFVRRRIQLSFAKQGVYDEMSNLYSQ